jgi:hypothetical protein
MNKTDREMFTGLHKLDTLEYEKVVFGMPSACISVCALLTPGWLEGIH